MVDIRTSWSSALAVWFHDWHASGDERGYLAYQQGPGAKVYVSKSKRYCCADANDGAVSSGGNPVNKYAKGRKNEYRTMRVLESLGYVCIRAAGSHSPFDIVALSSSDVVLVQCKSNEWPSPAEIERMLLVQVPVGVRKIIHRWDDHARLPMEKSL